MTGKLREIIPLAGGEWLVSFITRADPVPLFVSLKDKEVSVDIKRASRGRSRDANSFCWALCSDIGRAMSPPLDKEDVYRRAIKAVGVYTPVTLIAWDVPTVLRRWSEHGTGWFAEVVDDAGMGRKLVNLYFGSSTYTVSEMQVLIEWLMDECRQMGLPVPLSQKETDELLERWGNKCHR